MFTLSEIATVNDKISKAWIFSTGVEVQFPFNKEHYYFVPEAEGTGDYTPELIRGGVRMLRAGNCIACNIWSVSKECLYLIVSFMRRRLMVDNEYVVVVIESTGETLEFNSFKDICQYFNLKFN